VKVLLEGIRESDGKHVRLRGQAASLDAAMKIAASKGMHVTSAKVLEAKPAMPLPPESSDEAPEDPPTEPSERDTSPSKTASSLFPLACIACAVILALMVWATTSKETSASGGGNADRVSGESSPSHGHEIHRNEDRGIPAHAWTPGEPNPIVAHVHAGRESGEWEEDPGYAFDRSGTLSVSWRAGLAHPSFPHITSGNSERTWTAEPGYDFPMKDSLAVAWEQGRQHPEYPHITSGSSEGTWLSDPGYRFLTKDALPVRWVAGIAHPSYPHISSDAKEGYWAADAGYDFIKKGDLTVRWTPGMSMLGSPHVVASATEGKWEAAPGYAFQNTTNGDFAVIKKASPRVEEAIQNAIAAALFNSIKTNLDDSDNPFAPFLGELARQARQEAFTNAIRHGYPDAGSAAVTATVDLIGKAVDGSLTADNWLSQDSRAGVISRLRDAAPSDPQVYELADFVCGVCAGYKAGRQLRN
jgi:hypothetical protein